VRTRWVVDVSSSEAVSRLDPDRPTVDTSPTGLIERARVFCMLDQQLRREFAALSIFLLHAAAVYLYSTSRRYLAEVHWEGS